MNQQLIFKSIKRIIMKAKILIWTILLSLMVSSCIPSLFPLYKKRDLKTNDLLLGQWKELQDEKYVWEISYPTKPESGALVIFEDNRWSNFDEAGRTYRMEGGLVDNREFALHLLELDGTDYLNLYPMDWEVEHDFLSWHLVEANIFARADIGKDTLVIRFFNPDFLEQLIRDNRLKISHVKLDDRILITAGTEELQKFVKKFGHEPDAYGDAQILVRAN
jgi:hypothetical protein